jgi:hypothetical protein
MTTPRDFQLTIDRERLRAQLAHDALKRIGKAFGYDNVSTLDGDYLAEMVEGLVSIVRDRNPLPPAMPLPSRRGTDFEDMGSLHPDGVDHARALAASEWLTLKRGGVMTTRIWIEEMGSIHPDGVDHARALAASEWLLLAEKHVYANGMCGDWGNSGEDAALAIIALAETRRALAIHAEYFEKVARCQLCDVAGSHEPTCLLATMPRPVEP